MQFKTTIFQALMKPCFYWLSYIDEKDIGLQERVQPANSLKKNDLFFDAGKVPMYSLVGIENSKKSNELNQPAMSHGISKFLNLLICSPDSLG